MDFALTAPAGLAITAPLGLLIGSFLNVVAYRVPRGESLVKPGSHCTTCGDPVKPWDNIPVVSWLVLRGRCANCGEKISPRYPLVEALTAVLFALVVIRFGADQDVWLPLVFVLVLIPVTFIDLDLRVIPNKITGPAAVLAVILLVALPDAQHELKEHLIAGFAAFMFLFIAAIAYPAGMGMGDVKLAGVMGLYLGRAVGPAMLIAFLAGSLVGIAIMARKGRAEGRKTAVPFGPFLALGSLVGLFAGDEIVDWYLDTFDY
jgi:leader peptidase (prepilin peptidase)/N-methyltransferase